MAYLFITEDNDIPVQRLLMRRSWEAPGRKTKQEEVYWLIQVLLACYCSTPLRFWNLQPPTALGWSTILQQTKAWPLKANILYYYHDPKGVSLWTYHSYSIRHVCIYIYIIHPSVSPSRSWYAYRVPTSLPKPINHLPLNSEPPRHSVVLTTCLLLASLFFQRPHQSHMNLRFGMACANGVESHYIPNTSRR